MNTRSGSEKKSLVNKEPTKSSATCLKDHLDTDLSPTATKGEICVELERTVKNTVYQASKQIAGRKVSVTRLNDANLKQPTVTVVNKSKIKLPPRPSHTSLATT